MVRWFLRSSLGCFLCTDFIALLSSWGVRLGGFDMCFDLLLTCAVIREGVRFMENRLLLGLLWFR